MTKSQKEDLKQIIKSPSKIYLNEPMKKHTSLKVGGPAEVLIEVANIETLEEVLAFSKEQKIPTTIIGNGSNLLVLDGGIKGITLKIDIQKLEIEENKVKVGAGNKLIRCCI